MKDAIAVDYSQNKRDKYVCIMKDFIEEYLQNIEIAKIHSYRSRVKDPEHLAVKVIRKKQENYRKYEKLDKDNYEKFITDLIGIRCFVLFKADWENFHQYILKHFENNTEYYIKDCISDFDKDENHCYIAEKPKVHIRNGDARDIYEKVLPPDCVVDDKIYRSVHYILKYKGVYLEIQVRTLFEEGWGEVDHAVVYPYYQTDPILKEYTELINRLSGLADEMGSFFNVLKSFEMEHLKQKEQNMNFKEPGVETAKRIAGEGMAMLKEGKVRNHKLSNTSRIHTGEAEREEYHVYRNFLPTKNACMVYQLTGSDCYD